MCCYQILIRYFLREFPGFFQNILKQVEAALFKDGIAFPGILGFIAVHDYGDVFNRSFFELRLDGFCDFFGGMRIDIVEAFLDGVEQRILIIANLVSEVLYTVMIPSEE